MVVGKAHIVALTKEGDIFTFGMNNKGQCGREFPSFATLAANRHDQQAAAAAAAGEGGAAGGDEASDHEGEIDVEALGECKSL